jgi:hypothetical protein
VVFPLRKMVEKNLARIVRLANRPRGIGHGRFAYERLGADEGGGELLRASSRRGIVGPQKKSEDV